MPSLEPCSWELCMVHHSFSQTPLLGCGAFAISSWWRAGSSFHAAAASPCLYRLSSPWPDLALAHFYAGWKSLLAPQPLSNQGQVERSSNDTDTFFSSPAPVQLFTAQPQALWLSQSDPVAIHFQLLLY